MKPVWNHQKSLPWILFCASLMWLSSSCQLKAALVFEKDIAPILNAHCLDCHNGEVSKGELNLSSPKTLMRGGGNGPVVVAGAPEKSPLYEFVHSGQMPKKGKPLTEEQIHVIHDWIAQGARFEVSMEMADRPPHQHDVLPILLLRCAACHGPQRQDGGLDLSRIESLKAGGKNGPVFISGNADKSRMIQRIESEECPPGHLLLKFFVRRPPESEVETLRKWINAGAPEEEIVPDVADGRPDPLVDDKDRQHWAFQPPVKVSNASSIDFFISRKLNAKGLGFSPEADRDILIRRAFNDLTGLPPNLSEWKRWRGAEETDWYERMIDSLLASPRYGERWGRYWLDLAGYADSEGGVSSDPVRKVAWKYRDYVIHSFNEDKPYDRFLLEQLAGDELVDFEDKDSVTEDVVETLVATGFLRLGIDQTGSRTMNFVPERLGVIDDAMRVLGSGVMGLTMECARCHSHKYDPIPQRDYYRLKAVFQGAFDEYDWLSFKNRSLSVGTPEHRARERQHNAPLEKKVRALQKQLLADIAEAQLVTLRSHHPDQSEEDNQDTLLALKKADNTRTLRQKVLVETLQRAELIPLADQPEPVKVARERIRSTERAIRKVESEMVPPTTIRALWDRGNPSPTYILRRGEHDKPGRMVGPGVPSALTDGRTPFEVSSPGKGKTGRRLAFARWLTQPDHPLTSRVIVNRIWYHHFGTGLVKTLENFGLMGERPSHPELLDWLSVRFVEQGWSIKELHRMIMCSQTYRQGSEVSEEHLQLDPENRLLSRMPMVRKDAEALRDSLLFVSGKLVERSGGPPDPVSVDDNGLVTIDPVLEGGWRRGIYAQYRRTELPSFMDTFDYPEMGPNCVSRSVSVVSPQPLMLMNNARVRELATAFAERVLSMQGEVASGSEDLNGMVKLVYEMALSREPSSEEGRLGVDALKQLKADWGQQSRAALETYCHTILNSAGFLYVD